MRLFSKVFWIGLILTFAIIFAMNYIGNPSADRLSSALLNGLGGVVGLTLGLIIYNKMKGGPPPEKFD